MDEGCSSPLLYNIQMMHTCLLLPLLSWGQLADIAPRSRAGLNAVTHTLVVLYTSLTEARLLPGCVGPNLHWSMLVVCCLKRVHYPQITTKQTCSSLRLTFPVWEGWGLHKVLLGLLGNAAVSLSGRQSCRCPSYLFITEIINVYKRLLIALFTNDLWDLKKGGAISVCICLHTRG